MTESGELGVSGVRDGSGGLSSELEGGGLSLVVGLALSLSLLLQSVDDVLVTPSDLVRDSLEGAELSSGLETQYTKSGGDDHLLELVLGGGDTLEERESGEGGGTSGRLVGNHSSDGLVQDLGRSSVVERTGLLRVDNVPLVEVSVVPQLVSEKGTRNVDLLASDDRDLLAREDLGM